MTKSLHSYIVGELFYTTHIARITMKFLSVFSALILLQIPFGNVYAEWQFETISGVEVHYYLPKLSTSLISKNPKKALMVNLHGCAQKAEDLKKDGNWENTADEFNMIVAIPKVPNGGVYSGCWDYYGADHTRSNRNNEAIIKLVQTFLAKKDFGIDPNQVYVSGLSSGGGESMVLGCLAPDIFAGIGLNAAPSTGSLVNEISYPRTSFETFLETCKKLGTGYEAFFKTQLTSIIYGNNDFAVSTVFNIHNSEIMRTIYGANNKTYFDTKKLEGASSDGAGTMWSDGSGPRVSLILNNGLGHNWPAGQDGNNGTFINKRSLNYPNYLATFFFTNNRRSTSVSLPEIMINSIVGESSKFSVSGSLTIPKELVKAIEVNIRKKGSAKAVDSFLVGVDKNNHFKGSSKELADGEYDFEFNVKGVKGLSRSFTRNSWLGPIIGNYRL